MSSQGSKFFCVQPIRVANGRLVSVLSAKMDVKSLKNSHYVEAERPRWANIASDIDNLPPSAVFLKINKGMDFKSLAQELEQGVPIAGGRRLYLDSFFDLEASQCYLLFDYSIVQFTLIYQLEIKVHPVELKEYLLIGDQDIDLYNSLRGIFVREVGEQSRYSLQTLRRFQEDLIQNIMRFLQETMGLDLESTDISIPVSTGNITFIYDLSSEEFSEHFTSDFIKRSVHLNKFAEAVPSKHEPLDLHWPSGSKGGISKVTDSYYFDSRFHSICIGSSKSIYRYVPIQLYMQNIWFYFSYQINPIVEEISDFISSNDPKFKSYITPNNIMSIISVIERLHILNSRFKLSIEADVSLYEVIEQRWSIPLMLETSDKYVKFFNDYLAKLRMMELERSQKVQEAALKVISVLSIAGLISVWFDYLTFLYSSKNNRVDYISELLGGTVGFESFNFYFPIGIMFSILLVIPLLKLYR